MFYLRNKSCTELEFFTTTQLPLDSNIEFASNEINITENMVLYLVTDGFQDQFGGSQNKKFMTKRFRELLFSISALSMMEQQQILDKSLVEWIGEREQTDDITVVGVRI